MKKQRGAAAAGQAWQLYNETTQPGEPGFGERLRAVPRMVKMVLTGRYKGMSAPTLGMLALGLVYIVWPLDVIPEMIPIVGLADDLGVAMWVMTLLVRNAGDFVRWEYSGRPMATPGEVID